MSNTIFISNASYRPAATALTRLDTVLSSAEAALARAEKHLRRAQEARTDSALPRIFDSEVLDRYPQETGRR